MAPPRRGIYRTIEVETKVVTTSRLPKTKLQKGRWWEKRGAASAERYLDRVRTLPCSCCDRPGPSSAHHPRCFAGGGQKSPDWLAIALCHECHQGDHGIHGDRSLMAIAKRDEPAMLAITIARLNP